MFSHPVTSQEFAASLTGGADIGDASRGYDV
jgi:hypothetical protein